MPNFFYAFHFYLFALLAIASALAFVTRKSPVSAALWLVGTMFCLAVLYVMLGAHFIGAIQVLVYAGAIMVVFLFVVMLLNIGEPGKAADIRGKWGRIAAGALGLAFLAQVLALSRARLPQVIALPGASLDERVVTEGAVGVVAGPLFTEYLLAFELTSVLLLVAIVGAVVLAKRKVPNAR